MLQTIPYKNTTLRFYEEGRGYPIILLHGYLESLDIWENFSDELSKEYRVISIDLLGHGKSGIIDEIHTMEMFADAVFTILEHLQIKKCTIIGHSMGGYVTLSFLDKYSEYLDAFSLFHSTPLPDNELKKSQRDSIISEIKNKKKIIVCKAHVPQTFSKENLSKFVREIGFAKIIAINTPEEGIISALKGMKERKNYSELLKRTNLPFLYFLGMKDNFISAKILNHFKTPVNSTIISLKYSGHQGYIEEKELTVKATLEFMKKNNL